MDYSLRIINLFWVLLLLAACGRSSQTGPEPDDRLRALIAEHHLTGDPSRGRDLPDISDPLPQLGLKLFFSKALGGDNDSACASCHHPLLGGGDDLPLSIGVGADKPDLLGPGRTQPEGTTIPRNAPTTFNLAMWDQVLFHDGRIESLGKTPGMNGADGLGLHTPESGFNEADPAAGDNLVVAQSRFPVISPDEMKGDSFELGHLNRTVRTRLAEKLGGYGDHGGALPANHWLTEFQTAFNSSEDAETLITQQNIFKAIGEYERSQVFVNTPWNAYVKGDNQALTESAKRGALLFFSPIEAGGAYCPACHQGDFFTDEQFYVLAIPQVGPGKGDGPAGDDDFGRFRTTGQPGDLYAFRTPTLLNVEVTGPYGHDGAYPTLEGIVRHHLNPAQSVANYDYTQLTPAVQTKNSEANTSKALAQLENNRLTGRSAIEKVSLTDDQVTDIVSFLLALTDPCVKDRACLSHWLPSGPDPDGLQLQAVDQDGRPF
jgi:cytochrome c peroxidase